MAKLLPLLGGCLCLFSLALAANPALAEDGKDLFQKQCASCHTIGGGKGVGPDLQGVTGKHPSEWLVKIITEPDKLTAEKNPEQMELVKKFGMEMPKLGVSRDDALKIISFLQQGATPAAAGGAPAAPAEAAPVAVTPELLSRGRALFTGEIPFAKGGPPCVSCHDFRYPGVQGGSLAADLTGTYSQMGLSGVRGVLSSLSFPVMKRVYADRPLEENESTALIALLEDASTRNAKKCNYFPLSGLGFFALFIIAAIVVRRRIG